MENSKIVFGAFDKPDIRDWEPERLGIRVGEEVPIELPDILPERQFSTANIYKQDGYQCTAYGYVGNVATMARRYFHKSVDVDPLDQWAKQLKYGTAKETQGDTFQSALNCGKNYGVKLMVDGKWHLVYPNYARIHRSDIKYYAAAGYPTYTGSAWGGVDDEGYFEVHPEGERGHAFYIPSFDNTRENKPLISPNSWGEKWSPIPKEIRYKGKFFIKESDVNDLYSCYIIKPDFENMVAI